MVVSSGQVCCAVVLPVGTIASIQVPNGQTPEDGFEKGPAMSGLFAKLKRAGKCVGYMRFAPGQQVEYWWSPDLDSKTAQWGWHQNFQFDSIHLFVCKDRNGKDVFCDDWILFRLDNEEPSERTQITWEEEYHLFAVTYRGLKLLFKRQDIELVEDQP